MLVQLGGKRISAGDLGGQPGDEPDLRGPPVDRLWANQGKTQHVEFEFKPSQAELNNYTAELNGRTHRQNSTTKLNNSTTELNNELNNRAQQQNSTNRICPKTKNEPVLTCRESYTIPRIT
jgi:hypothetical protein